MIHDKSARRIHTFQTTWAVFWVAFLLHLSQIAWMHVDRSLVTQYLDHRSFGWEMGRIAHALVNGYGYADPFFGHTGPTAWVAPLYPSILAGVFKLFGDYSLLSARIMLAINCFLFAMIARTIYEIAARCFNHRVAKWAAWIWAFYPTTVLFVVWETILSTWLLTCIFVLALRMRCVGENRECLTAESTDGYRSDDPRTLRRWMYFALLWALLGLSNPSLLVFLPAAGIWILTWTPVAGKRWLTRQFLLACSSAALFLLCLAPWVTRNWIAFHRFVPMRSNFGAELFLGNGPGARGFPMMNEHPFQSSEQFLLYKQMGEIRYSKMRGLMARKFIHAYPSLFLRNTLRRITFFWLGPPIRLSGSLFARAHQLEHAARFPISSIAGLLGLALAIKRRKPACKLFACAFALLPLVYYLVAVDARFRFPLDPLIAILAVYLVQSLGRFLPARTNDSPSKEVGVLR